METILYGAGENLNHGTLQAAIDAGLEVTIPGDPALRSYGPAPDADANPPAYRFQWDPAAEDDALIEQ